MSPTFSIVIPTYERRDVVMAVVKSLEGLEPAPSFDVHVVVDGSTDGTADGLRDCGVTFPLFVHEQSNRGASSARNAGAAAAQGDYLLFLDDDMFPASDLLSVHRRAHRSGADVVIGHLPLHPDSPKSFLTDWIQPWAEERPSRLGDSNEPVPYSEILTGQLSIGRRLFEQLGGFDTAFTADGTFGNEDLEFGLRLQAAGLVTVFEREAISWQLYVVSPERFVEQYHGCGRADVLLERRHPEACRDLASTRGFHRTVSPTLEYMYRRVRRPVRALALSYVRIAGPLAETVLVRLTNLEYRLGADAARAELEQD